MARGGSSGNTGGGGNSKGGNAKSRRRTYSSRTDKDGFMKASGSSKYSWLM